MPRLAPEGQDIEQEIALLRSLANRLLSRRPLNYPYLFRCLNLIARCTTVKARYFNKESDEEIDKTAAAIRRFWESTMADRIIGYRELLPMIMTAPGKDWDRYENVLPIHPELLDSLLEVKDAWEREQGSPFVDDAPDGEEPPPFGMRPLPPHLYQPPDDDLPPYPLSVLPSPEPVEDVEDAPRRAPGRECIPDPLSVIPAEVADVEDAPRRAGIHPSETITSHLATHPSPSPEPPFTPIQAGAPNYWETDSFSSPIDPTGPSPDWPDPNPHPKPRIARGRPPP